MSPENHFKRFFPHNLRLASFTAEEQFQLLYRAHLLCVKSNRVTELTMSYSLPTESFVSRNSHGICCHPVFIDQDLFKLKRHLLIKPTFMVKVLIKNLMLQVDVEGNHDGTTNYRRHPTYPEDFRMGDVLKFVVPNEYQTGNQRYRVAPPFEASEGCFRWLVTDKHPYGYPYKLSQGLAENLSVFEFEI
jgi:hypothetical protein